MLEQELLIVKEMVGSPSWYALTDALYKRQEECRIEKTRQYKNMFHKFFGFIGYFIKLIFGSFSELASDVL